MSEMNVDASSGEPNEEEILKLKKEDMFKIVEDPYFQYLVEKKARAQTRTYLILVGTAILAILAYAGWEFKSVKDLINKEKAAIETDKTAIQSSRTEIEKTSADAKKQQEQMLMTADSVKEKVANSERLFADSQQFAKQSSDMTNGMLTAAQGNIQNSQTAQKELFQQQSKLLFSTFSDINKDAKLQLSEVDKRVNEVNTQVGLTNRQITDSTLKLKEIEEKAEIIDKTKDNLVDLTANANRLESIQKRLLKGGLINGTVFMRSKKTSTIKMLDPDTPENTKTDWLITFTKFQLSEKNMSVWGSARKGDAPAINFEVLDIYAEPSAKVKDFIPLPHGIPFQIQLNFAYHTFFSADFASLNIFGNPSGNRVAGNDFKRN